MATPGTERPAKSGGRGDAYHPALDGLRGLCLLGVLLFHCDIRWASGGFLGVSTFFTLSGFLITSILLGQWEQGRPIALARFWARRSRRLLPAALLSIAVVAATSPLWLPLAGRERLAGDAVAAAAYLVNWRFVQANYAYELIFVDPSPLQHFWSLAIEGQFYLVYPLLLGVVLARTRRRAVLAIAVTVLGMLSVAIGLGLTLGGAEHHRVYYGSDTRAAEILVGALLAFGLGNVSGRSARRAIDLLGSVALLSILALWSTARVEEEWLYRGGLAAYSILSAVVIAGCTVRAGLVNRALERPMLRRLGEISYGAYLFHWPIFLLLSPERTGLAPLALVAVRLLVTVAFAEISYRYFEEPIRRERALAGGRFAGAAIAALAVTTLIAVAVDPVSLEQRLRRSSADLRAPEPDPVGDGRALRHALFGDSMALSLSVGLSHWMKEKEGVRLTRGMTELGRGLLIEGEFQSPRGRWGTIERGTPSRLERWQNAVRVRRIDVAIVMVGAWEIRNWVLESEGPVRSLGDPTFDEVVREAVTAAVDHLALAGASVVWLTTPPLPASNLPVSEARLANGDARAAGDRVARLNQIIREVAAARPGSVHVVDLNRFMGTWASGTSAEAMRPDGIHFSAEGAERVVAEFLGPAIQSAVEEARAGPDRVERDAPGGREDRGGDPRGSSRGGGAYGAMASASS